MHPGGVTCRRIHLGGKESEDKTCGIDRISCSPSNNAVWNEALLVIFVAPYGRLLTQGSHTFVTA